MNDIQIEVLLIGAAKTNTSTTNSFVNRTMERIQQTAPKARPKRRYGVAALRLTRPQFVWRLAALILAVSVISFSGYAYAIDSNPIALIKRIVVGDMVKVEYKGRHFEHGKAQTYSDAAITAFAELGTIEGLYFG